LSSQTGATQKKPTRAYVFEIAHCFLTLDNSARARDDSYGTPDRV